MKLLKWLFYILAIICLLMTIIAAINSYDIRKWLAGALLFGTIGKICDDKMKGLL